MFPSIFQELNKQMKIMQAREARLESESKRATEKYEREHAKVCSRTLHALTCFGIRISTVSSIVCDMGQQSRTFVGDIPHDARPRVVHVRENSIMSCPFRVLPFRACPFYCFHCLFLCCSLVTLPSPLFILTHPLNLFFFLSFLRPSRRVRSVISYCRK